MRVLFISFFTMLFTMLLCDCFLFFFFKQKTAYEMRISDWSSDVCSSDLHGHHRSWADPRSRLASHGDDLQGRQGGPTERDKGRQGDFRIPQDEGGGDRKSVV